MSKVTQSETIRKLKPYTRMLSCKLIKEELLAYGQDLARVRQEILVEELRQVNLKAQLKASLTEKEAKSLALSSKIEQKEELRDVEVEPQLDFKKGTYCEVRLDTGEKISERSVTDEERHVFRMKKCAKCGEWFPLNKFYRGRPGAYTARCLRNGQPRPRRLRMTRNGLVRA